ncbi:MAG: hypothetical protein LBG11_02365 [Bifidobacteriaceae bacterium]|nr:hypothetical protein [Bifidobacteriaceae bacterium]
MAVLVALVVAGAVWVSVERAGSGADEEPVLSVSEVTVRDIAETISLKGSIREVSRTVAGATSLRLRVSIDGGVARRIVAGSSEGEYRLAGDARWWKCAETALIGAWPEPLPDGGEQAGNPRVDCVLSTDSGAIMGDGADFIIRGVTPEPGSEGALQGTVVGYSEPEMQVYSHHDVRAVVDPSIIHSVYAAIEEKTAVAEALIATEGRRFDCETVSIEATTTEGDASTHVVCRVPEDEVVYAGVQATVLLTLRSASDALVVPASAVRSATAGKGIVVVIDSDGEGKERTVVLGISDGLGVQIIDGLAVGAQLLDPVTQLTARGGDGG